MAPPVALRQACSRPRLDSGITFDINRLNTTRWAPMKMPNIIMKNSTDQTSGLTGMGSLQGMETAKVLLGMNQPESAMPRMARRPMLPIRTAAGITFLRCSILVPAKMGEMIPPTCCRARPRPTMVLEPEIWNR